MRTIRLLIACLWFATPAVAAQPWSDEAAAVGANPNDGARRVALGTSLAADPRTAEEGVAVLSALVTDTKVGADARAQLATALANQPARVGWRELYTLALDSTTDPDLRTSLKLRKALAEATDARTRKTGLAALVGLAAESSDRADVVLGVAHGYLLAGDASAADKALRGNVLTRTEAREAVLLAALAGSVDNDAAAWTRRLQDARQSLPADADAATLRAAFVGTATAGTHLVLAPGPVDQLGAALTDSARAPRARALLAYGYPDLAISVLRESRPAGATDAEAVDTATLLGATLLSRGDATGAVNAYEAAATLAPNEAAVRVARARALLAAGRFADARTSAGADDTELSARISRREALDAALKNRDPKDDADAIRLAWEAGDTAAPVPSTFGLAALKAGQLEAAYGALKVATDSAPADSGLARAAVAAAAKTGHASDAIAIARGARALATSRRALDDLAGSLSYAWLAHAEELKAAGATDDAIDAYVLSHALSPADPGTLRALGGAYWSAGRLDDAWSTYKRAFELDPADPGGLDAIVKLADITRRDKEVRALLSAHADDRAVRTAMRNFELRAEITAAGQALKDGDVDGAADRYQRLMAKDPSNPSVLRGLGDVAEARGDLPGAVDFYRKAHEIDPSEPWGRLGLANLLLRADQLDAAESTLQPLVGTTDPRLRAEVDATRSRLLLKHGAVAAKEGRDLDALQLFQQSMELAPTTWTFASIAQLYATHAQYPHARAFFEEAEAADPSNTFATLGRIRLYIDRGYHDEAESMLGELDATDAQVQEVWRYLELSRAQDEANLARNVGDDNAAEQILADLAHKYPDDEAIRAAWDIERLHGPDPQKNLAEAKTLLVEDGTNERALAAAFDAGHRLRKTEAILPLLDAAITRATAAGDAAQMVRLTRMRDQAQFTVSTERGLALDARNRHDEAVDLLKLVEGRSGDDVERWDLIGGAWLAVNEVDLAIEAYDAAIRLEPDDNVAHIGRAGAYASSRRIETSIDLLAAEWERRHDPDIGLALVEMYQARNDQKDASALLDAIEDGTYDRPLDPLPELDAPSGRLPEPFPPARRAVALSPAQEEKHRELRERSPHGVLPGVSLGGGIYARPGYAGEQYLTSFFFPLHVYALQVGPVAFDVEATAVMLDDAKTRQQGGQMSVGLTAQAGPVDMQFRGGVSPVGFSTKPYFIWFGEVGVKPTSLITLGVRTSREPVIDSLTSWAGKGSGDQAFGRVSRISFGGWFGLTPTDDDKITAFGKGGWHTGLNLTSQSPFWEVGGSGGHWFRGNIYGVYLGGNIVGSAFADQIDKFSSGQGGFFSPSLFVSGTVRLDADMHTRNDKFHGCVGGALGPQYIAAEALDANPANYISPGIFLGYQVGASLDWQIARFWWIGADYQRLVTGNTWQQNTGMIHLHFGPANAWARRSAPTFSPLAPTPVRDAQICGNP